MTNNPKNKNDLIYNTKKPKTNSSELEQDNAPRIYPKDIFDDDKLLQAEKRWMLYKEQSNELIGTIIFFSFMPLFFAFATFVTSYPFRTFRTFGIFGAFPTLSLLLLVIGILMIVIPSTYRIIVSPKFKRIPHYFSCIAESKNGSLDEISDSLGYPYDVVVSDIEFLINKGILEKTFINRSKRIVVSQLIGESVVKKSKSLSCPNCGATNTIIGKTTECEYCGSTISDQI